jgi:hypothetical protein
MIKKIEEQRFEFVFYINKHIICQRYFGIKDFNEDSIYSLEIKELMDRIVGMGNDGSNMGLITASFKSKSIDYLWKFYNTYNPPKAEPYKNNFEKEDFFDFEIRIDKEVVAASTFSGNFFPPQVRYQVDIKELIPNIISEIKDTLSKKSYTFNYADVEL